MSPATLTSRSRMRRLILSVVAASLMCPLGVPSLLGQEGVPPDPNAKGPSGTKKAGEPSKSTRKSSPTREASRADEDTTFLFKSDVDCAITIDGEPVGSIAAHGLLKAPVSIGQHVVTARSGDGKRQWEQIVEAKGKGQIIVPIDFAAGGMVTKDEFDRRAAGVRKAMADLDVAADFGREVLDRSFGFHNQEVSTTIFTAVQSLKAEMESLKAGQTNDSTRKRVAEDIVRSAGIAEQYADIVTKAIAAAQSANSWAGEPSRTYSQAAAMLPGTKWSADTWQLLRGSTAFAQALPPEEQARLGLVSHQAAFDLGAKALYSDPQRLVCVAKDGLADEMGLKAGDRIVSFKSLWDLKVELAQNAGKRMDVEIERKGRRATQALRVPTSFPSYPTLSAS
jgi:hypothetical protein